MLLRENYTKAHIVELREQTGADPSILERTVFAFGLLEAIRRSELCSVRIQTKILQNILCCMAVSSCLQQNINFTFRVKKN